MAPYVAEILKDFCGQNEEFAQAVVQGGSFSECMDAVVKAIRREAISCIEIREKDNTIMQIHGYRNEFIGNGRRARDPEDRFRPFLSEWLGWVKAGSKRTGKASRKDETA